MFFSEHLKKTFLLAYPMIIGQIGHVMLSVVDSVMVGRVGADELAAASLANAIFFQIFVFGLGVSFAVSPLVAMAKGAGNQKKCGLILRQSFWINIILSALMATLILIASFYIHLLNQPPGVSSLAASYLRLLGLSAIPFMIFQTYRQFSEGLSFIKSPMVITLAANLVNFVGNYLFIFGKFGFPEMGLSGAGLATLCTRIFMAVLMTLIVVFGRKFSVFQPNLSYFKVHLPEIKKILSLGIPSGIQYFFEVGAFAGAAVIIGWVGANDLAAHQIALSLASISFMFALGFSSAGSIRVGYAVGKDDRHRARLAGLSAVIFAAGIMAFFGLLFILFKTQLAQLYITDAKVVSIASSLLVIAAFFQIFDGTQAVGVGILRGLADVKIPTAVTFIAYWVIALPVGYYIGIIKNYGAWGMWIGLMLGLCVSAVLLLTRFLFKTRNLRQDF